MKAKTFASAPADTRLATQLLTATVIVLILHAFYYYPYFVDDVYISLRYAHRFIEGHGLTWNDGEYVEGYSNLLWILLATGMKYLGMDMVMSVRLFGIVSAMATAGIFAWYARKAGLPALCLAIGLLAYALTACVALWSVSGMESCMVMLLFGWATALCYPLHDFSRQRIFTIGLLLALLCPLRPEAPLYTAIIAAGLLLWLKESMATRIKIVAQLIVLPMFFFAAQLAFRLYYYDAWVANTVAAKVIFTLVRIAAGISYLCSALIAYAPLLLYVILNTNQERRTQASSLIDRQFPRFMLTVFLLFCTALIFGGGDPFKGFRAFLPLVPLIIIAIMEAARYGLAHQKKEMIFIAIILAAHFTTQHVILDHLLEEKNEKHRRGLNPTAAKELGLALKDRYGQQQPLIATNTAGAVPYYSGLPALDVYGLNDAYLTAHRFDDWKFGQGLVGHELFNGAYIESRKPDILVFDVPELESPCVTFGNQCDILLPHYRTETLHITGYDVTLWIRKDSKKLNPSKKCAY